jgi:hypothetical protein
MSIPHTLQNVLERLRGYANSADGSVDGADALPTMIKSQACT